MHKDSIFEGMPKNVKFMNPMSQHVLVRSALLYDVINDIMDTRHQRLCHVGPGTIQGCTSIGISMYYLMMIVRIRPTGLLDYLTCT